jgi:hypothetical protein
MLTVKELISVLSQQNPDILVSYENMSDEGGLEPIFGEIKTVKVINSEGGFHEFELMNDWSKEKYKDVAFDVLLIS